MMTAALLGLLVVAVGCNSILGIGPPSEGAVDAATPSDGGVDAGSGPLTATGSLSSVGGSAASTTGLTLVNSGFENGQLVCDVDGELCATGGLTP